MRHYDYVIAGTGCAGLSLAIHLLHSGAADNKKILLVDRAPKKTNDKTWCFWETNPGIFEPLVHKRWNQLAVYGEGMSRTEAITPYTYKMIRSIDFYDYCHNQIRAHPAFEWQYGEISEVRTLLHNGLLVIDTEVISGDYIFTSVLPEELKSEAGHCHLLQHFKGWLIETSESIFDPHMATLMDFSIPRQEDTAFMYVLPLNEKKALIEYTVFGNRPFPQEEYEKVLKDYISRKIGTEHYMVLEQEYGVIPMTSYPFPAQKGRIVFVGAAGGQIKASTGYAFQFIQQHSANIVRSLTDTGKPFSTWSARDKRFKFYDKVLLYILSQQKIPGAPIFTRLFHKNRMVEVLRFLENKSTFYEELKIMRSLPKKVFLKAAISVLKNY